MGKSSSKKAKGGKATMKHKKMSGGFLSSFFEKKKPIIHKRLSLEEEAKKRKELNGIVEIDVLLLWLGPMFEQKRTIARMEFQSFNNELLEDIETKLLSMLKDENEFSYYGINGRRYLGILKKELELRKKEKGNQQYQPVSAPQTSSEPTSSEPTSSEPTLDELELDELAPGEIQKLSEAEEEKIIEELGSATDLKSFVLLVYPIAIDPAYNLGPGFSIPKPARMPIRHFSDKLLKAMYEKLIKRKDPLNENKEITGFLTGETYLELVEEKKELTAWKIAAGKVLNPTFVVFLPSLTRVLSRQVIDETGSRRFNAKLKELKNIEYPPDSSKEEQDNIYYRKLFELEDMNLEIKKTVYLTDTIDNMNEKNTGGKKRNRTLKKMEKDKKMRGNIFKPLSVFNPLSQYTDANGVIVKITKPIGKKHRK